MILNGECYAGPSGGDSSVVYVHFGVDGDGNYYADKTFAEVASAITNKKVVIGLLWNTSAFPDKCFQTMAVENGSDSFGGIAFNFSYLDVDSYNDIVGLIAFDIVIFYDDSIQAGTPVTFTPE